MRTSNALVLTAMLLGLLPVRAALTHRYSFSETSGTTASDSVGSADGSLESGAFFTGAGLVEFDGTDDFVDLPDNIITNYNSVTIEAWVNDYGSPDWARVFDFGRRNGTVGDAWLYLGYPPAAVTGGQPTVRGEVNPPAPSIIGATRPSSNAVHHLVLVLDGPTTTARIYIDGALSALNKTFPGTPATVGNMTNVWLGQSQFSGDARFYGQIDEFRTWSEALSGAKIQASYVAGADTVNTNAGSLTNLSMAATTPMVVGGIQTPVLTGYYDNLPAAVNVTDEPGVLYTSANTNIVTVTNGNILRAVSTGTTTVQVIFDGLTNAQSITVIAESSVLFHRYSCNEASGTTINDSVGTAHGTVVTGTLGSGLLALNGAGDHATLPAGILSGLTNATFQFWARWDYNATPTRYFDFGTNNGTSGVRWIQASPNANNAANRQLRLVINDGSGAAANASVATPTNQMVCVTAVFNDSADFEKAYFDGVLVAQNLAMTKSLANIPNVNNYLGKSQFAADPTFAGAFDEFRIFNGAMSDFEVAVSSAAGPNNVVTNPGSLLAIRVVAASTNLDAHGASTTFAVFADYSSVTNVNVTSQTGLALTSSASNIVVATAGGQLQPAGAGVATVNATFQSFSGSLAVTVTDTNAWPKLLHRYNFNEGTGTAVNDTIGTAHGTIIGSNTWTTGRLVLPGGASTGASLPTDSGYVDLPNGLISGLPRLVSFESWIVWGGGGINQRIFDFGTSGLGEDIQGVGAGKNYLMLTPSGGGGVIRSEYYYNDISMGMLAAASQIPPNNLVQVVVTHDADRQLARLYTNGVRIATITVTNLLSDLPDINNWLGRAQWPDPYFQGSWDDFRIWNGALTDGQVLANYAAGPNIVLGPSLAISPSGANVALRWPANATNYTLQATTTLTPASWSAVGGSPSVVNSQNVLTITPSASATFYRLAP